MRSWVLGGAVVVSLAWALPAQAQLPSLGDPGEFGWAGVCVAGECTGSEAPPEVRDLLDMNVGDTLVDQCAGQPETVYRVSDDVWVSTCPPERTDYGGGGQWVSVERITPIVRASAAGETWTLVYSSKTTPAGCWTSYDSFVGLEQGTESNPPKTGVSTSRAVYEEEGAYC